MNQRERMPAGLPYKARPDGLEEECIACKQKIYEFSYLPSAEQGRILELLKQLLGKAGEHVWIEAPFHCNYGWNIEVGENFFANYSLTLLDVRKITVGKNAQTAPNIFIYTVGHPIHPDDRNIDYEYGTPTTIGDSVWIGGNAVILPGVTIGNNVVIDAGSVVSKDIPGNVIVVGNPCKVTHEITEDDRKYYYKNRELDMPIE